MTYKNRKARKKRASRHRVSPAARPVGAVPAAGLARLRPGGAGVALRVRARPRRAARPLRAARALRTARPVAPAQPVHADHQVPAVVHPQHHLRPLPRAAGVVDHHPLAHPHRRGVAAAALVAPAGVDTPAAVVEQPDPHAGAGVAGRAHARVQRHILAIHGFTHLSAQHRSPNGIAHTMPPPLSVSPGRAAVFGGFMSNKCNIFVTIPQLTLICRRCVV